MANPSRKIDAGSISIEFSPPIEEIEADLAAIGRDLSNMRTPLTQSVKQVVIPSIDANFAAGGRPAWEPLAPNTVERRNRQGTGLSILQVSGRLRAAATQFSRWNVDTDSAQIANWPTDVITRAGVHQNGAEATGVGGASRIPARPFLMLQDDDQEKITEIFLTWMELRARGRWSRGA
jgi:phage virion morphogenesis protein